MVFREVVEIENKNGCWGLFGFFFGSGFGFGLS